jgi:hypothetical protein
VTVPLPLVPVVAGVDDCVDDELLLEFELSVVLELSVELELLLELVVPAEELTLAVAELLPA